MPVLRVLATVVLGFAGATSLAADLRAVSTVRSLTLEAARVAAVAALEDCKARGATVAVVVVDRSGVPLTLMRDPLAGMHTPDTAFRKAWTAVSFKGGTSELMRETRADSDNSGIRFLPNVAMLGGGLPVRSAGQLVGGIGVSGAPGGDMDDDCAEAGIEAIREALELG
ncbi:MAG: heme-binding protein [Burkholderiales bacterium]|nr:MAG: heme-binding protein [Burkholderiales bacterium]